MDAAHALFGGLIDYAGLFPPAELAMQDAAEEYAAIRSGGHAWMAGRFLVPASRAFELAQTLDGGNTQPYALSAVVDAGTTGPGWLGAVQTRLATLGDLRAQSAAVRLEMLEAAVPAPAAVRDTFDGPIAQFGMAAHTAGLRDLAIYVELPRTPRWDDLLPGAMAALKRAGFGAKIRCGGVTQAAFPSSAQIAAFVLAATQTQVAFKATAGLHHPVRGTDATGLAMHGFLNVLAAVLLAQAGATQSQLTAALDEEDAAAFTIGPDAFAYREHRFAAAAIRRARTEGLVSYGSCSFEEPIEDLVQMGMLAAAQTPA